MPLLQGSQRCEISKNVRCNACDFIVVQVPTFKNAWRSKKAMLKVQNETLMKDIQTLKSGQVRESTSNDVGEAIGAQVPLQDRK